MHDRRDHAAGAARARICSAARSSARFTLRDDLRRRRRHLFVDLRRRPDADPFKLRPEARRRTDEEQTAAPPQRRPRRPEPMAAGIVIRAAHFPGRAPIDAYGNGGFRFADMSHRGSILCLPSGIYGWEPADPLALDADDFDRLFAEAGAIEILLVGTGTDAAAAAGGAARRACSEAGIVRRPDVDRRGGPHLQRPARRGPRRRGGADRRRLSVPSAAIADAAACDDACARPTATAISRALFAPADKRAGAVRALCLQCRDRRASATVSASRCRARSGCNGGGMSLPAEARAPRPSGRRCAARRRSRAHACRAHAFDDHARGAHLRSLRRSDADRGPTSKAIAARPRRR